MIIRNIDLGILILRLSVGVLMLFHGIAKIFNGIEGIVNLVTKSGLPGFIAYGVYVGEVIVPIMLMIGLRTRIAALVFAFNMIVAALLAHPDDILTITQNGAWGIELIGLYIFGSIALFFTGGGKYSVTSMNKWD